jgi:hypothetical protein
MEQDGKKVLVPWDEYQGLLKDSEALKEAREELKRDCEERGLYVETKFVVYYGGFHDGPLQDINPRLNIASKDETLKAAQEEIDRMTLVAKNLNGQVKEMEKTVNHLMKRNLWQRIINKEIV